MGFPGVLLYGIFHSSPTTLVFLTNWDIVRTNRVIFCHMQKKGYKNKPVISTMPRQLSTWKLLIRLSYNLVLGVFTSINYQFLVQWDTEGHLVWIYLYFIAKIVWKGSFREGWNTHRVHCTFRESYCLLCNKRFWVNIPELLCCVWIAMHASFCNIKCEVSVTVLIADF